MEGPYGVPPPYEYAGDVSCGSSCSTSCSTSCKRTIHMGGGSALARHHDAGTTPSLPPLDEGSATNSLPLLPGPTAPPPRVEHSRSQHAQHAAMLPPLTHKPDPADLPPPTRARTAPHAHAASLDLYGWDARADMDDLALDGRHWREQFGGGLGGGPKMGAICLLNGPAYVLFRIILALGGAPIPPSPFPLSAPPHPPSPTAVSAERR